MFTLIFLSFNVITLCLNQYEPDTPNYKPYDIVKVEDRHIHQDWIDDFLFEIDDKTDRPKINYYVDIGTVIFEYFSIIGDEEECRRICESIPGMGCILISCCRVYSVVCGKSRV